MALARVQEKDGVQQLLEKARAYLPDDRIGLIEEAYRFAETCHADQRRKSGEPFIVHPLDTALTVANLQLDADAVAAALLHDVQEDCDVPNQELKRSFGPEVAKLVDGATKLEHIVLYPTDSSGADSAVQAENLRRMFFAMAEDVRVVIIKLADRLHNMRTLEHLKPDKQQRIAQETMEIYAPLASRLGIWQIKWELEDLAFRYLQPEKFQEIAQLIASRRTTRERYIAQVEKILRDELAKQDIEAAVQGRAKHIHSVYQKMQKYGPRGRRSTRSMTCWPSACWPTPSPTATAPWARSTDCGDPSLASSTTISRTLRRACTSRFTPPSCAWTPDLLRCRSAPMRCTGWRSTA